MMTGRDALLFFVVCIVDGICIFIGSVGGAGISARGLYVGALLGGTTGVAFALLLGARIKLIERALLRTAYVGGVLGFALAAAIAVNNMHSPLVPVASVGLVGLGVLIGKAVAAR